MIYDELRRVVTDIDMQELARFQNLKKKIVEVMHNILKRHLNPTMMMVRNLIKIQESYINTYHPDFMGGANSIVNVFDMSNYTNNVQNAVEDDEEGEQQPVGQAARAMNKFGADMIKKNKSAQEDSAAQTEGRLQNFNQYEIQKYRKQEQPKIHMPDMPTFMRA